MYLGRGNNFFFDEWMFVVSRRGLSVDALLSPHNGHLSALPALAYMVLLKFFGLDHYEAFRFAAVIVAEPKNDLVKSEPDKLTSAMSSPLKFMSMKLLLDKS
jgi:hypothetical protein